MNKYTNVISSVKPEPMKIDDFSVWIAENVQEVIVTDTEIEGGEISRKEYHYDLIPYGKNEYIQKQIAQTINVELALAEMYEQNLKEES